MQHIKIKKMLINIGQLVKDILVSQEKRWWKLGKSLRDSYQFNTLKQMVVATTFQVMFPQVSTKQEGFIADTINPWNLWFSKNPGVVFPNVLRMSYWNVWRRKRHAESCLSWKVEKVGWRNRSKHLNTMIIAVITCHPWFHSRKVWRCTCFWKWKWW